jgi:hypothetical protein
VTGRFSRRTNFAAIIAEMEDPERRLRQILAGHIRFLAEDATREPYKNGACYQVLAVVRLWLKAGDDWDQPEAFGHFEHLMLDLALGPAVISVSDEELIDAARAVAEAARTLS